MEAKRGIHRRVLWRGVRDVCHNDRVASGGVLQHKTQRPVRFEITTILQATRCAEAERPLANRSIEHAWSPQRCPDSRATTDDA